MGFLGLCVWQGYDKDPGGCKKLMWYGILKEFNYKASFTWSRCGRTREMAYTHKCLRKKERDVTVRLYPWNKETGHFFLFPFGFFVCLLPPVSTQRWCSDPTLPTTSHHCATLLVFTPEWFLIAMFFDRAFLERLMMHWVSLE